MKAALFRWYVNLYPPFLGAGVRIERITPDYREIDVALPLRWYNRNYVGTQFGGSLYAMTDPFYMLMLMQALGPGYIVWDQAARIEFLRPGRGTVRARFRLPEAEVARLRAEAASGAPLRPVYTVEVRDEQDELVARVEKTLYVRRKPVKPA
jgi:acyl-coenzyme A thioesterase PaaI-like protein